MGLGPCSPGMFCHERCTRAAGNLPEPSGTGHARALAEISSGSFPQLGFVIKAYGRIYVLWAISSLLYLSLAVNLSLEVCIFIYLLGIGIMFPQHLNYKLLTSRNECLSEHGPPSISSRVTS